MMWEVISIYVLSFFDIALTYILLYRTKKSGIKNWYEAEHNALIRYLLKKYGLDKGIRIGSLFTFGLITLLFITLSLRVNWFDFSRLTFFMMGIYTMIITYHMIFLFGAKIKTKR